MTDTRDNASPPSELDPDGADRSPVRGVDVGPVGTWLANHIEGAVGPFQFDFITGGHSNLTYKVTASDGRAMVLRRPPLGAILASAHDMAREFKIISGVGKTTVPVPAALGLCEDETVNGAPFYIMEYVEGVVIADDVVSAACLPDPATRRSLSDSAIDVLAALHTADPDTIGLGDLGRKDAYLDRQLKRWVTQWEKAKTRELPEMDEAHELLVTAKPEQRYTGIVHGDYRLGNMLSDPRSGTVKAVLDWELCTLGDVLADVGYILNNWGQPGEPLPAGATAYPTTIGGFSTRDELVARYCGQTGFEVEDVNYYRAFQYWRLAAIVEGVLNRYLKGVMVDDSVDTELYGQQVASLVTNALTLLRP